MLASLNSGLNWADILHCVSESFDKLRASGLSISLAGMQVDVTNRLVLHPADAAIGFPRVDAWKLGGLRNGSMFVASEAPGVGKTGFSLSLANMVARAADLLVHARGAFVASASVAIRKEGRFFQPYRGESSDTTLDVGAAVTRLCGRHEQVMVFVDGVEALGASAASDAGRVGPRETVSLRFIAGGAVFEEVDKPRGTT